jgi:hypothetical protein
MESILRTFTHLDLWDRRFLEKFLQFPNYCDNLQRLYVYICSIVRGRISCTQSNRGMIGKFRCGCLSFFYSLEGLQFITNSISDAYLGN